MHRTPATLTGIVCLVGLLLGAAQAQTPAEFRVVSSHAFAPPTLAATVQVEQDVLDLPAGVCTGFHHHGGPGIETVLAGEVVVETRATATTPASSKTYKAGEAYIYPAGDVHNFCNMTTLPASYTAVLLLPDGAAPTTPDN